MGSGCWMLVPDSVLCIMDVGFWLLDSVVRNLDAGLRILESVAHRTVAHRGTPRHTAAGVA